MKNLICGLIVLAVLAFCYYHGPAKQTWDNNDSPDQTLMMAAPALSVQL